MTSVLVRGLDAHVRISVPGVVGALVADRLADLTPDGEQEAASATGGAVAEILWQRRWHRMRRRWRVSLAGEGVVSPVDTAGALAETLVELNRLAAASVAATAALLHASVFDVGGRAVAVSGVSGAGKSTLAAAAVQQGHGFVSDEVCAIAPGTWVVQPYHRPIGLRAGGAQAIGVEIEPHPHDPYEFVYPWRVSAHGGRLAGPTPLAMIALIERHDGPVELEPVRPAEALFRLSGLTIGATGREREMFRRLEQLVREVPVVRARYASAADGVAALEEAVAT